MRPVLEGLCKYESLLDGTLNLYDLSKMNAALDVKIENENRLLSIQQGSKRWLVAKH